MKKYKFQYAPNIRECCRDAENLEEKQERSDVICYTCKVCGASHRIWMVEPVRIFDNRA